jgi:hypothetical protein
MRAIAALVLCLSGCVSIETHMDRTMICTGTGMGAVGYISVPALLNPATLACAIIGCLYATR